jgi:hypothetical protein
MSDDLVKDQIMTLLAHIPAKMRERVQLSSDSIYIKVESLKRILEDNPNWKPDPVVFGRILNFTENHDNKDIKKFRFDLIIKYCYINIGCVTKISNNIILSDKEKHAIIQACLERGGVLIDCVMTLKAHALNTFAKDDFWDLIREENIKKLIIQKDDGQTIQYELQMLQKLVEKKPPIEYLSREYTLEFDTGERIQKMTKASLLLCGNYFEDLFKNESNPSDTISLHGISINGFLGVMDMMETGKMDEGIDVDAYKTVAEQLQFSHTAIVVPQEGIYGKEEWEKFWGTVGEVPPLPQEAYEHCPIILSGKTDHGTRMIDKFDFIWRPPTVNGEQLTIDLMEKIAKSSKFGTNQIGYEYIYDAIRKDKMVNKEVQKGYWYAMLKKPLEETRNMTFDEQCDFIEKNFPKEYGFPTTDQAVIFYLMHRACNGTCVLRSTNGRSAYTRCLESVTGGHVVVGAVSSSGLSLFNFSGSFPYISVILTRNFI